MASQLGVAETETRGGARPEVLHQDIRARSQPPDDIPALRSFQIHGQPALVPVHRKEVGGVVALERRTPAPGVVPVPDVLDLDHVGAEIA